MRSLVVRWDDLRQSHCEGDRLSIFVTDAKTGKFKCLDLYVSEVLDEDDPRFRDEVERFRSSLAGVLL